MYKKALESEGCQAVHLTSIDEDLECDTFLEGFDQVLVHHLTMTDLLHIIPCKPWCASLAECNLHGAIFMPV